MLRLRALLGPMMLLAGCAVAPSHPLANASQHIAPAIAATAPVAEVIAPAAAVSEHATTSSTSKADVSPPQAKPSTAHVSPGDVLQPEMPRPGLNDMPVTEASSAPHASSPPPVAPIEQAIKPKPARSERVMAIHHMHTPARVNLSGVVHLVAMAGQQIDAQDMGNTVIYFMPMAGAPHPRPGTFTIDMHHRMFHPSMLVIPLGSTVRFPNRDKYLHNVFSVTLGSQFDLGLQGYGQVGQHTFTQPGLVLINCNVHPSMQATVLVVASPYIARPAANGQFTLSNLPLGPGTLTVWQPRAGTLTRHIDLPLTTPLVLRVVVTQPRLLPHARMSTVFPDQGQP